LRVKMHSDILHEIGELVLLIELHGLKI